MVVSKDVAVDWYERVSETGSLRLISRRSKKKKVGSSEELIPIYQTTRYQILRKLNLHVHPRMELSHTTFEFRCLRKTCLTFWRNLIGRLALKLGAQRCSKLLLWRDTVLTSWVLPSYHI